MDNQFIVLLNMSVPALAVCIGLNIIALLLLAGAVVSLYTRLQDAEDRIDTLLAAAARTSPQSGNQEPPTFYTGRPVQTRPPSPVSPSHDMKAPR